MKRYNKGFTLIELLVVIAIIGILASVVLVSLQSARSKGKDTRIISDVQQLRTAFETGYNGSSYPDLASNVIATTAGSSTAINLLVADLGAQGGTLVIKTDAATAKAYAIGGGLTTTPGKFFCLASDGTSNQATSSPASPAGC